MCDLETAGQVQRCIPFLQRWQDLIGALIGALALLLTVWWTLNAERRRRNQDAADMRVALSAEVRQFARRALKGHKMIMARLRSNVAVAVQQLTGDARSPEPVGQYPSAS